MIKSIHFKFFQKANLYSWGSSWNGQLALGKDITEQYSPKKILLECNSSDRLRTGSYHCLLIKEKSFYSWGSNNFGQLGLSNDSQDLPVPALNQYFEKNLNIKRIVDASTGAFHSIVAVEDNDGCYKTYSFGWNERGQLGHDNWMKSKINSEPKEIVALRGKQVTAISGGFDFTIISTLSNGVYAFGMNDRGQCGLDPHRFPILYSPTVIPELRSTVLIKISSGWGHTLAMNSENQLLVWGSNFHGQLGTGSKSQLGKPVPVQQLNIATKLKSYDDEILDISCASSASLIMLGKKSNGGYLYISGSSGDGKLGISGQKEDLLEFTDMNLPAMKQMSMGKDHGLAVPLNDNLVFYGWGFGQHGAIGLGDKNLSVFTTPVKNDFFKQTKSNEIIQIQSSLDTSFALIKEDS
ncbi:regulator of chromosome condensation domain-containing protein [Tieghemostelium lacteum]|uniref:Regulator of chromosome condensation domain-containing protein n=1 Tax=Tieghemostelium lacteum TaxID=361077 RepID=A0A151Z4X7_TIELA|nr:regulator of chromosome condensation domain-containing protein [Tieghemostelium lacteum]|eukprot:KYQ89001.1 regulator of chromosome condensation domain-containing protein [Tieghemostelium lacteum]